jgi:hypothetical protein
LWRGGGEQIIRGVGVNSRASDANRSRHQADRGGQSGFAFQEHKSLSNGLYYGVTIEICHACLKHQYP